MKCYFNYFKSSVLVSFIATIAILIYLAKDRWGISLTIGGTVSTLLFFISKYLWKYIPFQWMYWIDNFSGRYEGILKYQYIDDNGNQITGEKKQIKIINQTGYRISVTTFTLNTDGKVSSPSTSKGMFVEKTEDEQHYRLVYNYLNEGSIDQGFPPHYGTEVIKFIKDGKEKHLSGTYYTNRHPYQTKGELVDFKYINNDLSHKI